MKNTATLTEWGNSFGIRISKSLVAQLHAYSGEVFEISIKADGGFILTPVKKIRANWTAAFNEVAKSKDDNMLIDNLDHSFDQDEWTW